MNDEELKTRLQHAYRSTDAGSTDAGSAHTTPPDFDLVWDAAEAQARRRVPYRAIAAGIAAVAAVVLVSVSQRPDTIEYDDAWIADIDESLLNTAAWSAPSDALLPQYELDIYTTLPTLFESTELEVDALL